MLQVWGWGRSPVSHLHLWENGHMRARGWDPLPPRVTGAGTQHKLEDKPGASCTSTIKGAAANRHVKDAQHG